MHTRRLIAGAALVVAAASPLHGQVSDSLKAAVHRIYGTGTFFGQRFGPARFIENGAAYTTVEPAQGGGADIVRYESATGARSVLVPAFWMRPEGASAPLDFDDYEWSADRTKILLFTNTQRVWRQNTRGDYWALTLATHKLQQVGKTGPASTLMYAKFSPDASRVAYVRQGDIYVERLADAQTTQLTSGSSATVVNGMSDWVYEEEFSLRDGFRWSPDGKQIAFWQFDMSNVGTYTLINDTDSLYPHVIPIQYPKAGTTNSAVKLGVVSVAGGKPPVWLSVPGNARENYLPWMEWAGPQELLIQHLNRKQNQDDIMLADPTSGSVKLVMSEKDSAWVDLVDDVTWLDNGKSFLWPSERDGWNHIYSVSRDGKTVKLVTPGAFDVVSVAAVDEAGGWIYYIASPTNATQRYLYRSKLDGTGTGGERVSPADKAGWHGYTIAPGAKWALHTFSTFDSPNVTELIKLPTHEVARTLVDNARLRGAAQPYINRPTEFFQVPVSGGVKLDGWMIRPKDFDSTKTYPVLFYVYGEPAGQTAQDRWTGNGEMWYRTIADQGYIVVSVDNQGTPSPRGRQWRKIVYGSIGVLSSKQQADAVQVLTRSRHYMDSTRVAIWGWSGGGSSTLQAMFRYPDVYQVGMSVAPVPDERLYDTIYQERYMGTPQDNAEGYQRASAVNQAEGLKGRLLLVHGSGDDNVHYQGSERLVNRLVSLGKSFDFMTYPNRSHCICEGQGTTEHIQQLLTRYLIEHLPAGGR